MVLCDELISRPEESYRLWCVVVCDIGTSWMRRPWPTGGGGLLRQKQKIHGNPRNLEVAVIIRLGFWNTAWEYTLKVSNYHEWQALFVEFKTRTWRSYEMFPQLSVLWRMLTNCCSWECNKWYEVCWEMCLNIGLEMCCGNMATVQNFEVMFDKVYLEYVFVVLTQLM